MCLLSHSSQRPHRQERPIPGYKYGEARLREARPPGPTETVGERQSEASAPSSLPEPAGSSEAVPPAPLHTLPVPEEPPMPHWGLQLPIRRMGEGGHSHLWLLLAPSVPDCVTDGRERWGGGGAGVSPSRAGRQTGSPGLPHTVLEARRAVARRSGRAQEGGERN